MILTGNIKERVNAAVKFGRQHRCPQYNEKYVKQLYHKSGVPFTDAAEKFWRDWFGVMDHLKFYPDKPNIVFDDGKHCLSQIDFEFYCLDEEEIKYWYHPTTYPELREDYYPDYPGIIRAKYGADTVPVATGGYYYYSILWICPNGKLIAILPDDGEVKQYNTLEEFLCFQLEDQNPCLLEITIEEMKLTGTLEERKHASINFAKKHGGFDNCRLHDEVWSSISVDVNKLSSNKKLSDDEIFDLLVQELYKAVPCNHEETLMPGMIEVVMK